MNKNVSNIHKMLGNDLKTWAFTGSVALMYHNLNKGFEPRTPQNIDIVVDKENRRYITSLLRKLNWELEDEGKIRTQMKKGSKSLDIIVAGSNLAPKLNKVFRKNGIPPILGIQNLFNRKKRIYTNENFNIEKSPMKRKTIANLNRLRKHGAKN